MIILASVVQLLIIVTKTTVLNGILSNDFDVNGLFTGIANLQATIKPLLRFVFA